MPERDSTTHGQGGTDAGAGFLLGNRRAGKQSKQPPSKGSVRSRKHPCGQRQAAHACPPNISNPPANPACPGLAPRTLPSAGPTRHWAGRPSHGHACSRRGPAEQGCRCAALATWLPSELQTEGSSPPARLQMLPSPGLPAGLTSSTRNGRQGGREPPALGVGDTQQGPDASMHLQLQDSGCEAALPSRDRPSEALVTRPWGGTAHPCRATNLEVSAPSPSAVSAPQSLPFLVPCVNVGHDQSLDGVVVRQ